MSFFKEEIASEVDREWNVADLDWMCVIALIGVGLCLYIMSVESEQ